MDEGEDTGLSFLTVFQRLRQARWPRGMEKDPIAFLPLLWVWHERVLLCALDPPRS